MVETVLAALVAIGVALNLVLAWALRRHARSPRPPVPATLPAVSILKPLKGVDAQLEANLASFFRIDYPEYEVLLGVDDEGDPALAVARRVAAAHPQVPSRIVVDGRRVGWNPKVNNLANVARHASHDLFLVSDSNVRVDAGYLADLVAHLAQPGVGLVSSQFRGTGGGTLGAQLESLQLNTFVAGGVALVNALVGGVCVVGKSMLLRRQTVAAIGGFERLSCFLAEDQVSGEDVAALGLRVVASPRPIDNVLGPLSFRAFVARHLRWARIRRRMNPAAFAGELLLSPLFVAALAVALAPSDTTVIAALAAWIGQVAAARLSDAALATTRPWVRSALLVPLRDLLVGASWVVPWFSSTVTWRGNRLRIGPRTRLVPDATTTGAPALEPAPASPR